MEVECLPTVCPSSLLLLEPVDMITITQFHERCSCAQLAVAGAVVAAGIAIVAGVRGLKKKEEEHKEPETGFEKLKRKVSLCCDVSPL